MVNAQATMTIPESEKRTQIRKYFTKPKLVLPSILLAVGILLLLSADSRVVGLLIAIAVMIWFFIQLNLKPPSDETIDSWFREDMETVKKRSLGRLNLQDSPLYAESLVITGPILWNIAGILNTEIAWRKGKDGRARFSTNGVTVIHFTENKLSSYQCDYNFIRGVSLNEHDDEYYYKDVVAVHTSDESTNYTLPNNQLMKHAQSFTLSVTSGERISVIIGSRDIVDLTRAELVDAGIDSSIKAIRKVLSEKKV
jgi:hypothetical protein